VATYGKWAIGLLWLVVAILAAAVYYWYGVATGHEQRVAKVAVDGATVVLMIGAVSVGIERALEYLWTVVGMAAGSFWPLSSVGKFAESLTAEVGRTMDPHIEQAQAIVAGLRDAEAVTEAKATQLNGQLAKATDELKTLAGQVRQSQGAVTYVSAAADVANNVSVQFQALVDEAHGSATTPEQRFALAASIVRAQAAVAARRAAPNLAGDALNAFVAARADAALEAWTAVLPPASEASSRDNAVREYLHKNPFAVFGDASAALRTSISGVTDFLASFKDNPGRRMLSLELGMAAGLAIALFTGVDEFAGVANDNSATQQPNPATQQQATDQAAGSVPATVGGILFTGLLMGLGSSPTHEVIRVVQEAKKQRKTATAPETEDAEAGGGQAVALTASASTGTPGSTEAQDSTTFADAIGISRLWRPTAPQPPAPVTPVLSPRAPRAQIRVR